MKLWSSFLKELTIASRGFYFYVEIIMAAILLFVLLFVVPENFGTKADEYLYLDFPSQQAEQAFFDKTLSDGMKKDEKIFEIQKIEYKADMYENDETRL